MTQHLKEIREELKQEFADAIEPFESWSNADALRKFWKPANVKVVFLEESHVFTGSGEASQWIHDGRVDGNLKLVRERVALDLRGLLDQGFIRRDPINATGSNVRVIIYRDFDGRFFIKTNKRAPGFYLGECGLES